MFGQIVIRSTVALFAWATLLGCSSDATPDAGKDSAAGTVTDSGDVDDPDRVDPQAAAAISLIQTLADRDETLLEMARIAVNRREQVDVSADARRMLIEQRRESNRLLGALKSEYRITHRPTIPQSELDLIGLMQGAGAGEFDRVFLDGVVKHHEGDLRVIDEGLPKITKPQIREMVTGIRALRVSEAATFKKQLAAATSRR